MQSLVKTSTRNIPGGAVGLTTSSPSCAEFHENLGAKTSWNPLGHTRPVTGHLYLYLFVFRFCFHSCTVHLDAVNVFYLPTDAQKSCFKRILKFTLKQLLNVSVQSPSSGSVLFELAKVIVVKIIS